MQCVAVCCSDTVRTVFRCQLCCSALQCVTVCCSVLQYIAVCCSALQLHSALYHPPPPVLQCDAVCWSVLQYVTVRCSVLQYVATTLQHALLHAATCVVMRCSVLQCVAVRCLGITIGSAKKRQQMSRFTFQESCHMWMSNRTCSRLKCIWVLQMRSAKRQQMSHVTVMSHMNESCDI